jgi:hypothetical protein
MSYALTERQQRVARELVNAVREGKINESFSAMPARGGLSIQAAADQSVDIEANAGDFDALQEAKMLLQRIISRNIATVQGEFGLEHSRTCTLTRRIYDAVDSNFTEEPIALSATAAGFPNPPEIAISLGRLRQKYPDPSKLGFLVMRFTAAKPFARIVEVIKRTAEQHDLEIVRADENEFHADLWGNVRTHLHGCGFGIAVYERIETEEPNANVGLEVGYLMAMNKPVLLLKDETVKTLQADLAGKLYKPFDPHDAEGTIPDKLTKWLEDNGIVVNVKSVSEKLSRLMGIPQRRRTT